MEIPAVRHDIHPLKLFGPMAALEPAIKELERVRAQLAPMQVVADVAWKESERVRSQLAPMQAVAEAAWKEAERVRAQLAPMQVVADVAWKEAERVRSQLAPMQAVAEAVWKEAERVRSQFAPLQAVAEAAWKEAERVRKSLSLLTSQIIPPDVARKVQAAHLGVAHVHAWASAYRLSDVDWQAVYNVLTEASTAEEPSEAAVSDISPFAVEMREWANKQFTLAEWISWLLSAYSRYASGTVKATIRWLIIWTLIPWLFGKLYDKAYYSVLPRDTKAVPAASAATTAPALGHLKDIRTVQKSWVDVYVSPKPRAAIQGVLCFGDTVRVLEKRKKWCRVECLDASGKAIQGWIKSKYVKAVSPL
jgi:hypothetical protein